MIIDPAVIPGLLLVAAELVALAAVGFVVVRVTLRQRDDRMALAQGLVVGPALWGVIANFVLYAVPGVAGAAVSWGVTLILGAVLAWRSPAPVRPRLRTTAGFAVAALVLVWMALASRQLLTIPDWPVHLGLTASLRAGEIPPVLPWSPGVPTPYHYGFNLLVGLLAPPVGPDLAFVTELLSAYIWMSFALIAVTMLIQRGSWLIALFLAPLLLTAGAWTLVFVPPPYILQIPFPAAIPSAGLRESLADLYWPAVQLPWDWPGRESDGLATASPPNIFKPFFTLGYALAFVVLERAAACTDRRWPRDMVLALLIGFLGLVDEAVAPIVLALWVAMEVAKFWATRSTGGARTAWGAVAGPALATLLLVVGGGVLTSVVRDAGGSGLSFGWIDDPGSRTPLAGIAERPGGVGLLGLGPFVVAGAAALMGWRDRLVLALAVAGGAFLLAALTLQYEFSGDITRLDGHARNFALLALLLALGARLAGLRPRWRYAAAALVVALVVWPTIMAPLRNFALAVGHGTHLANAEAEQHDLGPQPMGRHPIERFPSERIAAYIRDHTAVADRIFSPSPAAMSVATGRPNASGFRGHVHMHVYTGPEYLDVARYLEAAAIRRLGIGYVHAPDAWIDDLPDPAVQRLNDPGLFELLIRDGDQSLYRVRRALLELDVPPHPESFEALRSVPPSTVVHLAPQTLWLHRLRVASVLPHARLVGAVTAEPLHLRTPESWVVEPLGQQAPDLVVLPASVERWTWAFPPGARQPIWQNGEVAVYAPDGAVEPISPQRAAPDAPPVTVKVPEAHIENGRITFTANYGEHAPERWTGQDWVVVHVDDGPWAIPRRFLGRGRGPEVAKWFAGLISSGSATSSHTYRFDLPASSLAVRNDIGAFVPLDSSDGEIGPGSWVLALRLRHEWQPGYWREAAFIPVMRIDISDTGEISYSVYEDVRGESPP